MRDFASEMSYGQLGQVYKCPFLSGLLVKQGHKQIVPQSTKVPQSGGDSWPPPPSPRPGKQETISSQPQPQPPEGFCLSRCQVHWEVIRLATGGILKCRFLTNRNQRREAYSYFVTSGAPLVSGLVWKGQDARRGHEITCLPRGAGFGSSLVAVQSVLGEGGVCSLPSISGLH